MRKNIDYTRPEFWDKHYRTKDIPWDLGGIPARLKAFLRQTQHRGRVLIPGCGSGYEVKAFAEAGWKTVAIDFSPEAVERARGVLGALASRVVEGDFFDHVFGPEKFDLAYERTFLCALSPARRRDYVNRIVKLLKSEGRLIGIFFYGREPEPPPFPLTDETAKALFAGDFKKIVDEPVADSLPVFGGGERWQEWQRI